MNLSQFSTEELVKEVESSIAEFKRHKQDYDEERVKEQVSIIHPNILLKMGRGRPFGKHVFVTMVVLRLFLKIGSNIPQHWGGGGSD